MKRVLFTVAILAASVCAADEITSSNVLGILPVTSSAKRTIVSVPWCAMSATDNAAIQVSNVVKTANLTVDDMLHYVNGDGSYDSWKLSEGAGGVKYWASVNQASEQQQSTSPASDITTVARGNCIVLIRTGDLTKPFYLYGQVGTSDIVQTSVAVGATSTPAYTLIASPKPAAWSVNDASVDWGEIGASDCLYVPGDNGWNTKLVWNDSKWCYREYIVGDDGAITGSKLTPYDSLIPAGQGVWYVSYGGSPTIKWPAK